MTPRLLALTLALALAGCFDITPHTVFKCSAEKKGCPDGYTCNEKKEICEQKKLDARTDGPADAGQDLAVDARPETGGDQGKLDKGHDQKPGDIPLDKPPVKDVTTDATVPSKINFKGRMTMGLAYVSGFLWVGHTDGVGAKYTISKVDVATGKVIKTFGPLIPHSGGKGLTAGAGHLWITDGSKKSLHKFAPSWTSTLMVTIPATDPAGITFDGRYIWLTDVTKHLLYRLTTAGTSKGSVNIPTSFHSVLEWDGAGAWSNTGKHQLARYDAKGRVTGKHTISGLSLPVNAVAIGDGKIYLSYGGPDVYIQTWGPSCKQTFSEGFTGASLSTWNNTSLVEHSQLMSSTPVVTGGEYMLSSKTAAPGGHHRLLPLPVKGISLEIRAKVRGDHLAKTRAAVGLFRDKKVTAAGGKERGFGYTCRWDPGQKQVVVARTDGASAGAIIAAATVPGSMADSGWHDLACRRNHMGTWDIRVDGLPLVMTTNTRDLTYQRLTFISTHVEGGTTTTAALDDVALLDCGEAPCAPPALSAGCKTDSLGVQWCSTMPGCFTMGSPSTEPCRDATAEQAHKVILSRGFEISSLETTRAQYNAVLNKTPSKLACSGDCPVTNVDWHEAIKYCNNLSMMAGHMHCFKCSVDKSGKTTCGAYAAFSNKNLLECPGYRLPPEAEWEYAYRAGTVTSLHSGEMKGCTSDNNAGKVACYKGNSGGLKGCAAGTKAPNAWGLHDMPGNLAEWCMDGYMAGLGPTTQVDPMVGTKFTRVLRGGSFKSDSKGVRAASRMGQTSTTSDTHNGFRCVRTRNLGPESHFKLDEAQGNTVKDSGSAATKQGSISGVASWVGGVLGSALKFNGTSTYISSLYYPVFKPTESFSLAVWFRTTQKMQIWTLARMEAAGKGDLGLWLTGNGTVVFKVQDDNSSGYAITSTTTKKYNDGQWHHVVGVRDALNKKLYLYVDGYELGTAVDKTKTVINGGGKLWLGIGVNNKDNNKVQQRFKGDLDDFRAYRRALSKDEAVLLHSMSKRCKSTEQEYAGHCYAFHKSNHTWDKARAACQADGGDLVVITNNREEHFVKLATGKATIWLGYTDSATEKQWAWVTGETSTYDNWCSKSPANNNSTNCARLSSGSCWQDKECNDASVTAYYLCERIP